MNPPSPRVSAMTFLASSGFAEQLVGCRRPPGELQVPVVLRAAGEGMDATAGRRTQVTVYDAVDQVTEPDGLGGFYEGVPSLALLELPHLEPEHSRRPDVAIPAAAGACPRRLRR